MQKEISFNYGLDKKIFAKYVKIALEKNNQSNRVVATRLGISVSTFTRAKQFHDINVNSFLIISEFIKEVLKLTWEDFFMNIVLK